MNFIPFFRQIVQTFFNLPFQVIMWIWKWSTNLKKYLYRFVQITNFWDDILIFILSYTFCCKFVGIALITLSFDPFGSTSKGITLNNHLFPILGHFIALPINVYLCFITIVDNVLYLVGPSFVLGIFDTMYCTLSRVWNHVV